MDFNILERNHIYSGRVFNIELVRIKMPNGKIKNYDLVNHAPAVTIIPLDKYDNLYFVRQYRLGALSELIEFPAGVIEDNESPESSANRELREEIGLAAKKLINVGQFYLAPGYSTELMYVFLARDLYEAPLKPDPDEFIKIIKIHKSDINHYVSSGNLIDAKSLSALYLAASFF